MEKVIFDCDNTFGVKEKDVDDGLTLLYLLGSNKIELLGITNTFGNGDIETVYNATSIMLDDLNLKIPLYKGAGIDQNPISEASKFLVNSVNKYPNQITVLATGSLTNLYGAYLMDNDFFNKTKEIVLMGGITKPLIINGKIQDELNFSCNPIASYNVLKLCDKLTILTGHICLKAFFGEELYDRLIKSNKPIYNYIKEKTIPWFEYIMGIFDIKGFYNWDIVAAMYITNKELFLNNYVNVNSSVDDLKKGYLKIEDIGNLINLPNDIIDIEKFNDIVFNTWGQVAI